LGRSFSSPCRRRNWLRGGNDPCSCSSILMRSSGGSRVIHNCRPPPRQPSLTRPTRFSSARSRPGRSRPSSGLENCHTGGRCQYRGHHRRSGFRRAADHRAAWTTGWQPAIRPQGPFRSHADCAVDPRPDASDLDRAGIRSVRHSTDLVGPGEGAAAWSAFAAVRELAATLGRPSRLLICGSLYLAGKVLAENGRGCAAKR